MLEKTKQVNKVLLVVVDMQPLFTRSPRIIRECKKQIRKHSEVIFLEFVGNGATHQCLVDEAANNSILSSMAYKYRCGGGDVVGQRIVEMGLSPTGINVCGVWTDQCVRETALELANLFPDVTVNLVKSATKTITKGFRWKDLMGEIAHYKNVKLVP